MGYIGEDEKPYEVPEPAPAELPEPVTAPEAVPA